MSEEPTGTQTDRDGACDDGLRDAGQKEPGSQSPVDSHQPVEIGGPSGPEPTRYGDWERKGRCSDF